MTGPASLTWRYLAPNPNSCYKQLFVQGSGIRARVLFGLFMSTDDPMTPEEIAEDFDLPVAAVQEAIAYCQNKPPEIAEDFAREERLMDASGITAADYYFGGKFKPVPPANVARLLKS